ncbi:dienelactone hydrolase family protein, partial [bacterium]
MSGSNITVGKGSDSFRAYIVGSGPGVIVVQEWWGLVPHIEDVCDRIAAEGFTALAPDLYHGESTKEPDEAASLLQALNIAETEAILRNAVWALLDQPCVVPEDKVGIVGFCMGGQLAMFAASHNPHIRACVNFYGIHPKVQPSYRTLAGPVLGHFAERDPYADADTVSALHNELLLLDKPHEFHTYPGTDHAFFNDTRPEVYHPEAAKLAWERTLAFLR